MIFFKLMHSWVLGIWVFTLVNTQGKYPGYLVTWRFLRYS